MTPSFARRILALAVLLAPLIATAARAHGPASAHVAALSRELATHPDDAALWLERAEFLHADGHYPAALEDLDRAEALAPRLPRIAFVRGRVLLDAGDAGGAAFALRRYTEMEPEDGEGWALLGRARTRLGRLAEAADAFDGATRVLELPSPDVYVDRARALAGLGPEAASRRAEGLKEGLERLGPVPALLEELGLAAQRGPSAAVVPPAHSPRRIQGAEPPAVTAAVLTRGPYLQSATQTGVAVRWRTGTATNSRVQWGPDPATLTSVLDDPSVTTEHVMTITGLTSDTRRWYSVGSSTETLAGDSTTFFWTLPDTTFSGPTRLWAIGDSGIPGVNQNAVRDAYLAWSGGARTHLWLMLGDNAYQAGTDAEFQSGLFTPYAAQLRNQCLWPARGNHDVVRSGANNDYYEFFTLPSAGQSGGAVSGTEAYYAVDYGNVHLVCLDSEGSILAPGSAMHTWLRSDLLANTRPWVIAYWHHPAYTKGSHDSDDPLDSNGKMRDMRQYFVPLLDSLGVDLVLTGHSHSYERSLLVRGHYGLSNTLAPSMKVDDGDGRTGGDGPYHKLSQGPGPQEGAVHSVVGSSSQISGGNLNHPVMIASMNVLGSMAIEVLGNRLHARFISGAGAVLDSFAIEKGTPVSVGPPAASSLAFAAPHPNPARGAVRFGFTLPRAAPVRLVVMAADGRRVATLLSGIQPAGPHDVEWDGLGARGRPAPAGVYFGVLEALGERLARRFARVR